MRVIDFIQQIQDAVRRVGGENLKVRFERKVRNGVPHSFSLRVLYCKKRYNLPFCYDAGNYHFFDIIKNMEKHSIDYWKNVAETAVHVIEYQHPECLPYAERFHIKGGGFSERDYSVLYNFQFSS